MKWLYNDCSVLLVRHLQLVPVPRGNFKCCAPRISSRYKSRKGLCSALRVQNELLTMAEGRILKRPPAQSLCLSRVFIFSSKAKMKTLSTRRNKDALCEKKQFMENVVIILRNTCSERPLLRDGSCKSSRLWLHFIPAVSQKSRQRIPLTMRV